MNAKSIEVVLSVVLQEWFMKQRPNEDIETTFLEELGIDDAGVLLTVGDQEFRIVIEQTA